MIDQHCPHRQAGAVVPTRFRFASDNLDEAREVLVRFYYPMAVGAPDGVQGFHLDTELLRLGPVTVGRLQFGGTVTLAAPEVDGYHVTVPTAGRVIARQAGNAVTAVPSATAAVFRPGASVHTLHEPDTTQLDIKIDRKTLEAELAALLGRDITGPIDFAPTLDTARGAGRSWSRFVRLLRDEYDHPDGLLYQPLIAEQVRHGLLHGLLLSVPHRHHAELTAPAQPGPPRSVRRAVEAIRDEPGRPFTVAELAAIGGVSVRSLQEGFRRHLGMSPMTFLQQVRLERAHEALRTEDPTGVTVATVAHRWGFAHLGRFARAYRTRYGISPSITLRRGA
jgi:AraC-like DNA-binding protein